MGGRSRSRWVRSNFFGGEEVARMFLRRPAVASWAFRWFQKCTVGDCPAGGGTSMRCKKCK